MDQYAGVRGKKLAVCISLRSMQHGVLAREVPPAYYHLQELKTSDVINIEPMDASGVAAFIQTSYGPEPAISVSESLGKLMHSLSNGNPLYVKLAMAQLQVCMCVRVQTDVDGIQQLVIRVFCTHTKRISLGSSFRS